MGFALTIPAKTCSKCGERKRIDAFHRTAQRRDGRMGFCAMCRNSAKRGHYQRWTPEQREAHRARVLKCRYGITLDQLAAMYAEQGGACAICHTPGDRPAINEKRASNRGVLHIDHSHNTGSVRGLLCAGCNKGLGQFGDDYARLEAAARYVRAVR